MANAIVQVEAPTGLTLTLSLYAFSSDDTLANSGGADTLTEKANNKGLYAATVTEGLSGWHWAKILDGSSNLIGHFAVWMSDTTNTHRCVDLSDVYAWSGAAVTLSTGNKPDVNVDEISDDATAPANLELDYDGTGYNKSNSTIGTATNVTSTVNANVTQISGDSVAADNLEAAADGAGYNLGGGAIVAASVTGNVAGSVGSVTGAVGSVTGNVGGNVVGSVASVTGAVGSVTGSVGGNVTGSVGSLATQAKADVNAEVLDVLNTDTFAEPGQGTPAATASLVAKIGYMYKSWRNKKTQTSTQWSLYNDDTTTIDHKATVSDDGTTTTKTEIATGP